jgi:hypothetical protein
MFETIAGESGRKSSAGAVRIAVGLLLSLKRSGNQSKIPNKMPNKLVIISFY